MKITKTSKGDVEFTINYGKMTLKQHDVLHLEGEINYTTIYMQDGKKEVLSYTLKRFEEILPKENFFRVSKNNLINLKFVKSVHCNEIEMENGRVVHVSRRKMGVFKRLMTIG